MFDELPQRTDVLVDMDNSDYFGSRQDDRLGVNKIGKNIRKSPPHQPNFANPARQPPPPQVYNINKNDFQSIVQQLTGSPLHHSQEPVCRPHQNSPKPPSMRLQRIRPPRLAPINVNRPQMPVQPRPQMPPRGSISFSNNLARPAQYGQPPRQAMVPPPMTGGDQMGWPNTAESPISAYMRYLQHSIIDPAHGHPQDQQRPQIPGQIQQSSGLRPHPSFPPFPSPRMNGLPPPFPSPRMNGPPPPLPSPRINGPFIPPSPNNSQFLLPSPSGYMNLLSPLSPYPLISPGYQHPPPLTPIFSFSPMAQSGILGPGPQPPPSPGMGFPLSPGFFQLTSPRWRD